jgi:hypothetical protein
MSDPGSDPPTDEGPAPRPGTEKPLTGLQAAGVLAALALLPLLCLLVAVLLHADPSWPPWGRRGGRASSPSPLPSPSRFSLYWRCAPCGRRCAGSGRRRAPPTQPSSPMTTDGDHEGQRQDQAAVRPLPPPRVEARGPGNVPVPRPSPSPAGHCGAPLGALSCWGTSCTAGGPPRGHAGACRRLCPGRHLRGRPAGRRRLVVRGPGPRPV